MLLTLEITVFAFTVLVALITAVARFVERLNTLHNMLERLTVEIEYIKDHQGQQGKDIHDLRQELHNDRR
jgi:uncharacterized protein (DUF2141 family)